MFLLKLQYQRGIGKSSFLPLGFIGMFGTADGYNEYALTMHGLNRHRERECWLRIDMHNMPIYGWGPDKVIRGYGITASYRNAYGNGGLHPESFILFKAHDNDRHGTFPVSE